MLKRKKKSIKNYFVQMFSARAKRSQPLEKKSQSVSDGIPTKINTLGPKYFIIIAKITRDQLRTVAMPDFFSIEEIFGLNNDLEGSTIF